MSVRIFLSAVSDEFREYRVQLRSDWTRHNVEVKVEEDFKNYGGSTLENLDTYIQSCNAVVHLVGNMIGSLPKGPSIEFILAKYPDICDRLPVLHDGLGITGISYTQWEAWLAIYHKKLLFIAEADEIAPRGATYLTSSESRAAQRSHLTKLESVERFPSCKFRNPDHLTGHIAYSAILDLLAADRTQTGRTALIGPLVDMAAMVFVDLMRLACVAGSDAARTVNESRYAEFVDTADLHLLELRTHVTRITDHISLDAFQKCQVIERHVAHVLVRLRQGPKLDLSWSEFSKVLANLAAQILGLAELLHPDRYIKEIEEAGSVVDFAAYNATEISSAKMPDEFVRCRFAAQSMILQQIKKSGGTPIRTIRDDIDRRLAIPYLAIDATLLRATASESELRV